MGLPIVEVYSIYYNSYILEGFLGPVVSLLRVVQVVS